MFRAMALQLASSERNVKLIKKPSDLHVYRREIIMLQKHIYSTTNHAQYARECFAFDSSEWTFLKYN